MTVLVPLVHGLASRESVAAVRPITGADEMALATGDAESVLGLLAAISTLDGVTVDAAALSDLTVGDRNALLLGAVAASYVDRLSWLVDCPSCGEQLDVDVELADLLDVVAAHPHDSVPRFRVPTVADLAAVAGLEPTTARDALLERCVEGEVDDAAADRVEAAMAEADPLADITVSLSCAACGACTSADVDPLSELLARVTSRTALMEDVHALALAYGWTEPDVLALPRPRRHDYLVLVADLAS